MSGPLFDNVVEILWHHSVRDVENGCYCRLVGVFCVFLVIAQACAVLPTDEFAHDQTICRLHVTGASMKAA